MINDNTLNFIRFSSGFNNLKKEELEIFAENEIFELNEYNASEEEQREHFYTLLQSTDGAQGVEQGDGKYIHTAWAYSSDGTDRFSIVYPRLNLLERTKDFSGDWWNSTAWDKSGTYKGLTVMSYNGAYNTGITKGFTIPSDGIYSLSMLVKVKAGYVGQFIVETYKPTGIPPIIKDVTNTGGKFVTQSYTGSFKAGQEIAMYFRFNSEAKAKGGLEVAGHKIEHGEPPTPWMPAASEVTKSDWPIYMGQYTDYTLEDSIDPSSYTWRKIQGKYFYTLEDVNTNGTLKSYIIECLKLSLQTRWGNNLEYHIDRKTKYLNKLTGMQL